jgi:hypothetical protein
MNIILQHPVAHHLLSNVTDLLSYMQKYLKTLSFLQLLKKFSPHMIRPTWPSSVVRILVVWKLCSFHLLSCVVPCAGASLCEGLLSLCVACELLWLMGLHKNKTKWTQHLTVQSFKIVMHTRQYLSDIQWLAMNKLNGINITKNS